MAINNLESLISEYEQKRREAQMRAEQKKEKIYEEYPELEEFDNQINQIAIDKTKAILNNEKCLRNLDLELDNLKQSVEWTYRYRLSDISISFFDSSFSLNGLIRNIQNAVYNITRSQYGQKDSKTLNISTRKE